MKLLMLFTLFILASCNSPFMGEGIVIKVKNTGDLPIPPTPGPTSQPFTLDIPYTTGTDANYVLSDPTKMEIVGDLVRLKPTIHVDQNATATGFGSGLALGVTWDATNNFMRLNSTTNVFEQGLDWTPQISEIIAYYKLDEAGYNGTWGELTDSGPNGFHGISLSTFSNAPGKINNGAVFEGTRVIGTPDYDAFENHSKFSVAFWVKPTNLNGSAQGVVAKRNDYEDNQSFDLFFYSGNVMTIDIDGANNRFDSNFVFENDKWYHIVLAFDGTQIPTERVRFYVNGHLDKVAQEDSTFIPNLNAYLRFGSLDGTGFYNFHGLIDDVIFWKTALNYAEVQYMYMKQSPRVSGAFVSRVFDSIETTSVWPSISPVTPIPYNKELPSGSGSEIVADYSAIEPNLLNGLLAHWKLNEISTAGPNNILDSSGNNNHGTSSGSLEQGDFRGQFSRAALFAGARVEVPAPFFDNMPAFSISGWVSPFYLKNSAAGNDISIFGKKDVVEIGLKSGYICARSHLDSAEICGPSTAFTGEWTHIMVTGSVSTLSLYINGKFVNSAAHAGANYGSSANPFNLGAAVWNTSGEHYLGLMDEVTVWSRAITAAEVLNLYRRGGQTLNYYVRSCVNADCSDQDAAFGFGWKGSSNDFIFPFNEGHNYSAIDANLVGIGDTLSGALKLNFSLFPPLVITPNRYFQYKAVFSSNDVNSLCDYGSGPAMCSPELKAMTVGPSYTTTTQTITNNIALGSVFDTLDLNGFTESLGANGCDSEARYTLSSDGTNFYFYNGASWSLSNNSWAEANEAPVMNLTMNLFPVAAGAGTLQIRTYLKSDGSKACEVDNIRLTGTKP